MKITEQFQNDYDECETEAACYALGTLPEADQAAFGARLKSGCPLCTAQVDSYSEVMEHLAAAVTPVEPPARLRGLVLERIKAATGTPGAHVVRSDESAWKRLPIAGVATRALMGEETFLVRMQPGASFPTHEHKQNEQCYVLEGCITDSDGLQLNAGDFIMMPQGTLHRPIRTETGCLLLIAYTA